MAISNGEETAFIRADFISNNGSSFHIVSLHAFLFLSFVFLYGTMNDLNEL